MKDVETLISKAKSRLLLEHPFFATLLLTTTIEITERIPLAATDMEKIYINPDFARSMTRVGDMMSVLVHEVGHNALLHGSRMDWRDPMLWNIAGDHAINLMLEDQGFRPPDSTGWLADEKYKGWSADKIYDDLRQQFPNGGGSGSGGSSPATDRLHGDLLPTPAKTEAEAAEAERRMKQKVAMAANAARLQGKLKGDLAKLINDFLNPKVPWTDVLRDYLLQIAKNDESWARRNRRFSHVYLPDRHSEEMGPIVIIGDSSGSIWASPKELEQFATEIQSVADLVQPEHIRVVWADTDVRAEEVFERGQDLKFNVKGGGGTDMRVPLRYVEQYEPEVVILLTDGYTPWPQIETPYPLIVCVNTDVVPPVGLHITI